MGAVVYVVAALLALLLPELFISETEMLSGYGYGVLGVPRIVGLLGLWTAAYLFLLYQQWHRDDESPGPLATYWPVAVVILAAVWVKPVMSIDTLLYVGYGRQIFLYGLNPYKANLWQSVSDPMIALFPKTWFDLTAFYGPLALGLFTLAVLLGPARSIFGVVSLIKLMWVVPLVALAMVLYRRWSDHPKRDAMLLALLANPFLIFLVFVDGHPDMALWVLMALAAMNASRGGTVAAALLWVAAASVKIVPVVAFPVMVLWLWQSNKLRAVQFAVCFGLIYAAIYAAVDGGEYPAVLGFTGKWQNLDAANVVPLALWPIFQDIELVRSGAALTFYGGSVAVGLAFLFGRLRSVYLGISLVLAIMFFTRGYFQPWHVIWFWPMLFLVKEDGLLLMRLSAIFAVCGAVSMLYWWWLNPWLYLAGYAASLVLISRAPGPSLPTAENLIGRPPPDASDG